MIKEHFAPLEKPENEIRYQIYQLMDAFEKIHAIMSKLLSFELKETKAIDQIEQILIQMEKSHLRMHQQVKAIEKDITVGEEIVYKSTPLHEAVRRTYNLLSGLNVLDLNSEKWVMIMTRCLVDTVYYRQIKSIVFKDLTDVSKKI